VVLRFRHYRLWELALLAGLALLANVAVRSMQDWLVIMLALGIPQFAALLREDVIARRRREQPGAWTWLRPLLARLRAVDWVGRRTLRGRLLGFQWFWPMATVGVLVVLSLFPPLGKRMPRQNAPEWPVAALDRAEELGLRGRFFGPPDFGAYVGWRLGTRGTCYVDTRGFFFPPELLEDSILLPQLLPGWPERLDRVLGWGTDYFLLETSGPRGRLWHALQQHISDPLHQDESTVLLTAAQVRDAVTRLGNPHLARGK
jgi:hypothetical protein